MQVSLGSLPSDLSIWFRPNLLPLTTRYIIDAASAGNQLSLQALSATRLWTSEYNPSTGHFQELGRKLRSDYIMAVRDNYLELEQGPKDNTLLDTGLAVQQALPEPQVHSARAETEGVLFRVADGTVLWKDFASASMISSASATEHRTQLEMDRSAASDAVRFSLIELERKFRKYRSGFLKHVQEQ